MKRDLGKVLAALLLVLCVITIVVGIQVFLIKFALGLLGYHLTYVQAFAVILIADIIGGLFKTRLK
jgi:hypothetical protein